MVTPVVIVGLLVVLGIIASSVVVGTAPPLQLPATNQSVDTAPVQLGGPTGVAVAAKVAAVTPATVAVKD